MFDRFIQVRWNLEFLKRKHSEYKRPVTHPEHDTLFSCVFSKILRCIAQSRDDGVVAPLGHLAFEIHQAVGVASYQQAPYRLPSGLNQVSLEQWSETQVKIERPGLKCHCPADQRKSAMSLTFTNHDSNVRDPLHQTVRLQSERLIAEGDNTPLKTLRQFDLRVESLARFRCERISRFNSA